MVGERLAELRQEAGLSQEDLGKVIGVTNRVISGYERDENEPPDEMKTKLAQFFHVSIDYLLGVTDKPVEYKNNKIVLNFEIELTSEIQNEVKLFIDYIKYRNHIKPDENK